MTPKVARKRAAEPQLNVIPGAISATDARDQLGALLNRARYGNERIPITERGEVKAGLVGPEDLEFLEKHKPSSTEAKSAEAGAAK